MSVDDKFFTDTNLFLRYLTDDIPKQASAFEKILVRAGNGEFTLVTSNLVIAEIVWTLESYYQLNRKEIQDHVTAILNTPGLQVDNTGLILQALLWYVEKNVDYVDAYNAAWALSRGIRQVYTFDQKHFNRLEGLRVVVPDELI
ncbi:MAG: PIN domain-containing protein [Anaerolineales bacterium]|nr:PIN domain-containing protein [Anaerolineales bacterium]